MSAAAGGIPKPYNSRGRELMNLSSADLVRAKIDALRNTAKTGEHLHEEMKVNLTGFLERYGLIDNDQSIVRSKPEAYHNSGSIHLCPWHTCAATRHGMPQS